MRTCASVKSLTSIKDVTEDDAKQIRKIWQTVNSRSEARSQIDKVLRTFGVEYLGQHKRNGEHIYYCNTGESYASTVIFSGLHMRVGCWADLVEKNLIKENQGF
jgi:IS4 transposase